MSEAVLVLNAPGAVLPDQRGAAGLSPNGACMPKDRLDARAFEVLVREVRADLYRYALWLGRDPTVADDVVQEALVRAWRSFGNLRNRRAFKHWLFAIVRREFARSFERKQLETVDIADVEDCLTASSDDPDIATMRRAIFRLDERYREPLVLQALLGHSVAEIAQLMQISTGAVLVRLFRARKKLAAQLDISEAGEAKTGRITYRGGVD